MKPLEIPTEIGDDLPPSEEIEHSVILVPPICPTKTVFNGPSIFPNYLAAIQTQKSDCAPLVLDDYEKLW